MGKTTTNKKTIILNNMKFEKSNKQKRPSVINRIRDKTMGAKNKLHE
jgi:hypothetical protein